MKNLLNLYFLSGVLLLGLNAAAQDRQPAISQSTSTTAVRGQAESEKISKDRGTPGVSTGAPDRPGASTGTPDRPGLKQRQRRERSGDTLNAGSPVDGKAIDRRIGEPNQNQPPIQDRRPLRDPKRLRPDSLRRGGATDVDTVRH